MATLKLITYSQFVVPWCHDELMKLARRFEEKVYTVATSQSDYLQKISVKMLNMETKRQRTAPINPAMPNAGVMNRNSTLPGLSSDGAFDFALSWLQEGVNQIRSLKESQDSKKDKILATLPQDTKENSIEIQESSPSGSDGDDQTQNNNGGDLGDKRQKDEVEFDSSS